MDEGQDMGAPVGPGFDPSRGTNGHKPDCDWHLDQYPWECSCGLNVANNLTAVQRDALLVSKPDEALIFNPAACRSLALKGLLETRLTPLGLAVRNHIKDTSDE